MYCNIFQIMLCLTSGSDQCDLTWKRYDLCKPGNSWAQDIKYLLKWREVLELDFIWCHRCADLHTRIIDWHCMPKVSKELSCCVKYVVMELCCVAVFLFWSFTNCLALFRETAICTSCLGYDWLLCWLHNIALLL